MNDATWIKLRLMLSLRHAIGAMESISYFFTDIYIYIYRGTAISLSVSFRHIFGWIVDITRWKRNPSLFNFKFAAPQEFVFTLPRGSIRMITVFS